MKTKRMIADVLCGAMLFSLSACGAKNVENTEAKTNMSSEIEKKDMENVQIPSPWTEYDSIEEATKNAGYPFEIPNEIRDYRITLIQNMNTRNH